MDALRAAVDRQDKAWCGWAHALGHDPTRCVIPVSPFGATYVAVRDGARGGLSSLIKGRASLAALGVQDCTIQRKDQVSLPRMIAAVVGALLFWWAPELAMSTPFRLTSGTLGFVVLSLLFFVFMVYRCVESMPEMDWVPRVFIVVSNEGGVFMTINLIHLITVSVV